MVKAAAAAPTMASISTPVRSKACTSTRTRTPGNFRSASSRTSVPTTRTGWQRGIQSAVRLSAAMAARRAVEKTSPFFPLPSSTRARVEASIFTAALATATRSVSGLAPTSTMRARPRSSRWVRDPLRVPNSDLESEVLPGVAEADVLDQRAQQGAVVGEQPPLDVRADHVAQQAPEILVARVRQEAARVGQHPDEPREQAHVGERVDLLLHPVQLIEEPPGAAELHLPRRRAVLEVA